jgi:hypothetical protein
VSNGTLAIGQGVTVTGAGTALKRRDGSTSAAASSTSWSRTRPGADHVQQQQPARHLRDGAGVINITGFPVTVPAPNGQGTSSRAATRSPACASSRRRRAASAPSTASSLAERAERLALYGGEKVKVRNSVFLANVLNGVYVTPYEATAAATICRSWISAPRRIAGAT